MRKRMLNRFKGIYDKGRIFAGAAVVALAAIGVHSVTTAQVAAAVNVSVDGDPKEWTGVEMQSSTDSAVAKWAVMQDEDYVYFYVQQNGGNEYGLPITNTFVSIKYQSGQGGSHTQIRFANMMKEFKDAWYGDIDGARGMYSPSKEADKYEIEFAVPKSFFVEEDYTITYCGSSVESTDIKDVKELAQPTPTTAVYQGITIDGTFTDWDAVAKKQVDDQWIRETAAVFDGDYLYLYVKEQEIGSATGAGSSSNGKYTIYTDLGRHTTFQLRKDHIEGIDGAKVSYSNRQYEIAIPASAIRQYKETISFGYYMDEDVLIDNIANRKEDTQIDKNFYKIVYDGKYSDWDYYPHQLIQYSTSGGVGNDAAAALYLDGTTLYGHVLSMLHMNEKEFQPFTIRVNENDKTAMNFRLVAVDKDGNIDKDCKLDHLDAGTYEYYLWDLNSGSTAANVSDKDAPVYGKMYLTVNQTAEGKSVSDEVEYQVDLEKLADHFGIDASDMKLIQAQYINIGQEWVSIAGTSTGTWLGLVLCGLSVLAVFGYRKFKRKVV